MRSKKLRAAPQTERDRLFETLLGPEEELDRESTAVILEAYGIIESDLLAEFKSKVEGEASKMRLEGKTVPVPMQNVLKNLRGALSKAREAAKLDPNTWIADLLSGRVESTSQSAFSASFRGRKPGEALSSKDQRLLDSLKAEIQGTSE